MPSSLPHHLAKPNLFLPWFYGSFLWILLILVPQKLKTYYDNKNTRADIQFIKETIVRNISSIVLPS